MGDLITEVSPCTPRGAVVRMVHIRRTDTGRQVQAVFGCERLGDDDDAINVLA